MSSVKKTLPVLNMSCAACAAHIEKALNARSGVKASVNLATNSVQIEFESEENTLEDLQVLIRKVGYELIISPEEESNEIAENLQHQEYILLKSKTRWAIALALPVAILDLFFMDMPYINYIMWVLSSVVLFGLGRDFFTNAIQQAKNKTSNMDTLVALSTGVAYLFSVFNTIYPSYWTSQGLEAHVYFEAASVIIAFILIGRLLEAKAKNNTSQALKKLIGLQPKTVCVRDDQGTHIYKPISDIRIGDIVIVKPGDKIAVDGVVISGASYVDESMLSGEPMAVSKRKGGCVYAGTINQKGSLSLRVQKISSDTVLSQIIKLVQDAQGSKAPVQHLVDKVAGVFVPIVIGVSILSFILWITIGGEQAFTQGILSMITVFIIACPCALGLATPTAIMVGMGKGAEYGILIKDAESLEVCKKINAIVLDKTGTLTEGKPRITDVKWRQVSEIDKRVFISMERLSEHPLAESITQYFSDLDNLNVNDFKSITGLGIQATYEGNTYSVGSKKMMDKVSVDCCSLLSQVALKYTNEAKTIVWLAKNKELLGVLAVSDQIKKSSYQAVEQLYKQGVEVYMLTGDNEASAKVIAHELKIKHYQSEVLPSEKEAFIRSLQNEGKVVAMVGDGINDSAALARADIGIAMGQGSDIAIDVAKITIISSDLMRIPMAIDISKNTVQTIRENLFWAFIYNIIGIPLAAGVLYPFLGFLLNPIIASLAMALSSVSVVTNSLRLKWRGNKKYNSYLNANQQIKKDMKIEYKVSNMRCEHCHACVKKALESVPGVRSVTVDAPSTVILCVTLEVEQEELQEALRAVGDYEIIRK